MSSQFFKSQFNENIGFLSKDRAIQFPRAVSEHLIKKWLMFCASIVVKCTDAVPKLHYFACLLKAQCHLCRKNGLKTDKKKNFGGLILQFFFFF